MKRENAILVNKEIKSNKLSDFSLGLIIGTIEKEYGELSLDSLSKKINERFPKLNITKDRLIEHYSLQIEIEDKQMQINNLHLMY